MVNSISFFAYWVYYNLLWYKTKKGIPNKGRHFCKQVCRLSVPFLATDVTNVLLRFIAIIKVYKTIIDSLGNCKIKKCNVSY